MGMLLYIFYILIYMNKYEKRIKYLYIKWLKSRADKLYIAYREYKKWNINIKELDKYYFT